MAYNLNEYIFSTSLKSDFMFITFDDVYYILIVRFIKHFFHGLFLSVRLPLYILTLVLNGT